MSVQAISLALALRGVSPSEKLVVLVLANYANADMESYPSHKRLAAETGLSDRTILSVLKALEHRKIIARNPRHRRDGSRSSDIITLLIGGETISPRGEIERVGVGKPFHQGGETISPLTTFEPSIEPLDDALAASSPKRRHERGTRIPNNWEPTDADIQFANSHLTAGEIENEAAKFRDYWVAKAGAGGVKLDWSATWRNWVRTASARSGGNRQGVASRPGFTGGGRQGPIDFAEIVARKRAAGGY